MNLLFTCAGRRSYLLQYFRENMSEGDKIIATDVKATAPALQAADVHFHVPSIYDKTYLDEIMSICKKMDIDAIISLNDYELPILSENKATFEKIGVKVIVSDPKVIDISSDKYKTYLWIKEAGLKAPKTYKSIEEAKKALENKEVSFPLFLKPRNGSGSVGIEKVEDMEELMVCHKRISRLIGRLFPNSSHCADTSNNPGPAQTCSSQDQETSVLIQEDIPGEEYGLDVMNDLHSEYRGICAKRKLAMRSGETDKATIIDNEELTEIGQTLARSLKHIGNLDVDLIRSEKDGSFYILDLNPRFGGGFPFSYCSGVNLPKAIIEWIKGNTIDPTILQPQYGKTFAKNDVLVEIK